MVKKSNSSQIMMPIAIDLGSKNTGVYTANYPQGTHISEFKDTSKVKKQALVLEFLAKENKGYQILQSDRTAVRHTIRNRTRNKLAKRLLKLILKEYYRFPIEDKDHEKALNYLLNRRGYSYVESDYCDLSLKEITDDQLEQIANDASNGAKHRTKYFENINHDLKTLGDRKEKYLSRFNGALEEHQLNHRNTGNFKEIFEKTLCHINNFDLRSLRAFFNNSNGENQEWWRRGNTPDSADAIEYKLSTIFHRWICDQWIVNKEKNGQKKVDDYQSLKKEWLEFTKNNTGKLFSFWQKTDPKLTIPPYESQTNRRPPACQTLLLNVQCLTQYYPTWEIWLKDLQSGSNLDVERYNKELLECTSRDRQGTPIIHTKPGKQRTDKPNESFSQEDKTRTFQLLLDTSKKNDVFQLNKIWSRYHKLQQQIRDNEDKLKINKQIKSLNEVVKNSQLPESLKTQLTFDESQKKYKEETFGHLLNKYYQTRKRAKDGRYFIHYDNTQSSKLNRWKTNEKDLLRLCHHRPRQKKDQGFIDLQAIFGVDNELWKKPLEQAAKNETTKDKTSNIEKATEWLRSKDFKGLKTHCHAAAAAQKEHKGALKQLLDRAESVQNSNHEVAPAKTTDKQLLDRAESVQNPDKIDKKLIKLNKKSKELAKRLALCFYPNDNSQKERLSKRLNNIYTFAQMHNIVFLDRSGFSKTCPICSVDNGFRSQMDGDGAYAHASRLSALSLTIIDGAAKRLLNHKAHHLTNRLWETIEPYLNEGQNVSIPIILEKNAFSFEYDLADLKKTQTKSKETQKKAKETQTKSKQTKERIEESYKDKKTRIKDASKDSAGQYHCPYGGQLSGTDGQLDHILPRVSKFGTLNDEANFIYTSSTGNQNKSNKIYRLKDLNKDYLNVHFKNKNIEQITKHIYTTLFGTEDIHAIESKNFVFGSYRNFSNLEKKYQPCFRHALFLQDNDPARRRVIDAIQHNNKTMVNGTQRLFAQLVANCFWKKANAINKKHLLTFDYFQYAPISGDRMSPFGLRNRITSLVSGTDCCIDEYSKNDDKQHPYSHVIDATMAFLLATEQHCNEGTMRINIDENMSVWGSTNEQSEDLSADCYQAVSVSSNDVETITVQPQSVATKIKRADSASSAPSLHRLFSRRFFKENALGLRYKQLFKREHDNDGTDVWSHGYIDYSESDKPQFIKVEPMSTKSNNESIEYLVKQGFYSERERDAFDKNDEKVTYRMLSPKKKMIDAALFNFLSKANEDKVNLKDPKIKEEIKEEIKAKIKALEFVLSDLKQWVQSKPIEETTKVINKKDKLNPWLIQWKKFDEGWKERSGDNCKVDKNQKYIIDETNQKLWNEYCKEFFPSGSNDCPIKHKKSRKYSLIATTKPSGALVMIKKPERRNCSEGYYCMAIDKNIISKDKAAFIALKSKNIVLFDKSIFSKGYVYDTTEYDRLFGKSIETKYFINTDTAKDFVKDLQQIVITISTHKETEVTLSGIKRTYFEKYLFNKGSEPIKQGAFYFSDSEQNTINETNIKELIIPSIRQEKSKPPAKIIAITKDFLSMTLTFRSENLRKVLDKQAESKKSEVCEQSSDHD